MEKSWLKKFARSALTMYMFQFMKSKGVAQEFQKIISEKSLETEKFGDIELMILKEVNEELEMLASVYECTEC